MENVRLAYVDAPSAEAAHWLVERLTSAGIEAAVLNDVLEADETARQRVAICVATGDDAAALQPIVSELGLDVRQAGALADDAEGPILAYSAANEAEAALVRGAFGERGIATWVVNDQLRNAAGELPLGFRSSPRVLVRRKDRDIAALALAEIMDESRHEAAAVSATSIERDAAASTTIAPAAATAPSGWRYTCPECGRARVAECPWCHTSGTEFRAADGADSGASSSERGEPAEVEMLICTTCDEPFTPRLWRRCAWCGHDFGSGIDDSQPPGRIVDQRLVLASLGLATVIAAIAVYFAMVLR